MSLPGKRVPILLQATLTPPFESVTGLIDGFRSVDEIMAQAPREQRGGLAGLLSVLAERGALVWRDQWSPLRWCSACNLPLLQENCDRCGGPAGASIELKFPCNPRPVIPHDEFLFREVGLPWPVATGTVINTYRRPDCLGWELICGGARIGDIVHFARDASPTFVPAGPYRKEALDANDRMSFEDMVRANRSRLDGLEQEATEFIRTWCCKWRFTLPVVTYSGGKDSAVLAHLCHRSGVKMRLVHIDTGIDPPGTREYIAQALAAYRNLRPMHLGGDDIFWRALEKLGPPALDFQWCRIVLKNSTPYRSSTARVTEMLRPLGRLAGLRIVLIDGPRRREEPWRVVLKRDVPVKGTPLETVTIRPILEFTDLDVWMYLRRHAIPLHPTYSEEKHQRLVCLFCPDKDQHEMAVSRERNPQEWARFAHELQRWRKVLGFPSEWRTHHLWVTDKPESDYARSLKISSRIGAVRRMLNACVSLGPAQQLNGQCTSEGSLEGGFDASALARWLQPLGKVKRHRGLTHVECAGVSVSVSDAGKLRLNGLDAEAVGAMAGLLRDWLVSWFNCIGCGACRSVINRVRVKDGMASIKRGCPANLDVVREAVSLCPVNATGIERCLANKQDS